MNEQSTTQSLYGSSASATRYSSKEAAGRSSPSISRYSGKPKTDDAVDLDGSYAEELMELELQFNRKMESARRTDLDEKKTYRQRYLLEHSRQMEELQRLSNLKSVSLVEFFRKREEQLMQEFRRVLDLERLRWEGALAQKEEELRALYLQQQMVPPVREIVREAPARKFLPYFGLEIAEVPVQGSTDPSAAVPTSSTSAVKVVSASGPSAAAGIQAGDVIHQITIPVLVRSKANFLHALDKIDPGERVHFALGREGNLVKMMVSSESRCVNPPPQPVVIPGSVGPAPVPLYNQMEGGILPQQYTSTTLRTSSPYRTYQVYMPQ